MLTEKSNAHSCEVLTFTTVLQVFNKMLQNERHYFVIRINNELFTQRQDT